MSGGVDSSVAALLLCRQGYEATGTTCKLFGNDDLEGSACGIDGGDTDSGIVGESTCCSSRDIEDARQVAFSLGMDYFVFNYQGLFGREVIDRFCEEYLAMPVVRGVKTEKEKFSGAERTYAIECMMHDRKALQAGTSHYFGDGFAKAFDIHFTDKNNQQATPFETSWGLSTRLIGGIIMTHGDNNGLVLPPKIAPIQIVLIPVAQHKPGVLEKVNEVAARLKKAGFRVKVDDSEQSPGWKFAEYEMKGVPVRVEIGPRDLEKGQCCLARRDTGEKSFVTLDELESQVQSLLTAVHDNLYAQAEKNLEDNTFDLNSWQEVKEMVETKGGFARTKWCGKLECELKMKELAGVSSRCMPLQQSGTEGVCPVCGEKCTTDIYWGVAY